MKIGIDFDDVICRGPDDKCPEALSDEWNRRLETATPIEDSIESINKLIAAGHKIYFITARFTHDRHLTTDWLAKHGINSNDYTLCLRLPDLYGPEFKRILIGSLDLDAYIDDKPRLIDIAKNLVYLPILFVNWNQTMNEIDCIKFMRKKPK